ncbi:MAG TPA: hypothetical protein VMH02_00510, partial [Verrucomicrobiae bacterium]|nr:hypothetical protein [Verrucomicrobiae bacterium]
MSAFRMTYEPLLCDGAVVGRIGTIPWDSEIFERVVAAFELEDPPRAGLAALGAALDGWIEAHGARTVT